MYKRNAKLDTKVHECLSEFFIMMNEKASELGMTRSNFASAHGMHNEMNYSSAYDMAKLSCHILKDQRVREVVKTISK